jgi:hypothetical protein
MKLRPYKADAQFLLVFYFLLAKKKPGGLPGFLGYCLGVFIR